MRHKCKTMKTSAIVFILVCTLIPAPLHSSGSYSPSGSSLTREEYNQGKAIYHGRIKIAEFPSCISCHDSSNKLKRRDFENVGIGQDSYKEHCKQLSDCQISNVSDKHWSALMYFLQKRYRIKN